LKDGAGKPQPARRIVWRNGNKLAQYQHARTEVVVLEGCVSVALQRCRRLVHGTGVAFDLRFELDGSFIERALLEGLVGRDRRRQDKGRNAAARPARTKRSMDKSSGSSGSPHA